MPMRINIFYDSIMNTVLQASLILNINFWDVGSIQVALVIHGLGIHDFDYRARKQGETENSKGKTTVLA